MQAPKKQQPFNILLADDGSVHAQAAVSFLGDLPLPAGSGITVLRVFPSTQASDLGLLEQAMHQTILRLEKQGLQVNQELLLGSPAEKIVEYAENHSPDLIIVGAKGLRATLGILLGGVAQQVVEYALSPVLVVRAPYRPLRNLLVVIDGSPSSQQAVLFLGKFPLPGKVNLQVLHVLAPPPMPVMGPSTFGIPAIIEPLPLSEEELSLRKKQEKDAQNLLDRTVLTLNSFGKPSTGLLKQGDAATEIIKIIQEQEIDLVVTGSRGFGRVKSWLMGSLSRKLVHYSDCSVLVVRGLPTE